MQTPPPPLLVAAFLLLTGAAPEPARETHALLKDGTRLPLFNVKSDPTPVAKVGPTAVTLRELTDALAAVHQERGAQAAGGKDFGPVLDRLVNVHLVVLEAQAMGIPDLPEFRSAMTVAEERLLRQGLKQKVLAGVKADPRDVERATRDALREWTLRLALFPKEADARAFRASLQGGASFEAALKKPLAEQKARGGTHPQVLREPQLPVDLRKALRGLGKGQVTRPAKADGGFVVAQMLGKRQVDDPAEREKVRASVEAATRVDVLRDYYRKLTRKYAQVDEALLKKLDLGAPRPGLEALAKDERILARIQGEKPLTVGDLVQEIRTKFFHGAETQQSAGRLDARKQSIFDDMMEKRLFVKEARGQGMQDEAEFKYQLQQYADQIALAAAVERVVAPSVSVNDEDLRRHYREHQKDFTTPAMYKLDGIAFSRPAEAQEAMRKLRGGTDIRWLRANAEGQLPLDKTALQLDGSTVSAAEMPEGLADALAGSRNGDFRLYAHPDGGQYVVQVVEYFPPQTRPFESVKDDLSTKVHGEKLNRAFREWTDTLRKHYPVEILIARFGD
ncbi:MAG TPA: peptidylprolyl isomerase [Anaeromyxobacteraceae bacterium]|nr:peptidylprolyl isomerase [Anaeromyxobacteraceae bacterium]